ncbi:MAG: hypothetical protein JZD40_04420 [Sulfolobus sp.]|nr:hypothetical protein [Sulfolobus sp.]
MTIIEELIQIGQKEGKGIKISEVRVGINWTCVLSKFCGVSATNAHCGEPEEVNEVRDSGYLHEKTVDELAEYLNSWSPVESAIGLATINSVLEPKGKENVNALDLVKELGKGKIVTFVGLFPKINELKNVAKEVYVLELDPYLINPKHNILPSTVAHIILPKSDVVVITSSTIINKSIDYLLELSRGAYTILTGPSTPFTSVLFDYGVTVLAGIEVKDPKTFLLKISQGGGMLSPKRFKEVIYRVWEK